MAVSERVHENTLEPSMQHQLLGRRRRMRSKWNMRSSANEAVPNRHIASSLLSGFRTRAVRAWYKFEQNSRPLPFPSTRLCLLFLRGSSKSVSNIMSVNTALFVVSALLCLHAVRSLRRPSTLDGDCLVFWQASAYRPTTKSVVDENGHVVDKLSSKERLANESMAVA